ncbi:ATP-binding protein [Pontibacter sp. SGAir0037]|uniref:ATP-binding protein n=1 Tax=Pontibacter sp. SGAir0037 TaxID=2571030 RepID=UPI0010F54341|nr:ATP-binding protein [Pontibacter sp. SGAir0037]
MQNRATSVSAEKFFKGGGEMGDRIRQLNWSETKLGPIDTWPQSLRTAVSIMLSSKIPMMIHWGPELIHFYNDGYATIMQSKHPGALGEPAYPWWSEMWEFLDVIFKQVLDGETTYFKDQLVLPNRRGFLEEAYFTFSHSPIYDETGKVGGIYATAIETTTDVVNQRRLAMLSHIAATINEAKDAAAACKAIAASLATNPEDVPFALLYLIDKNEKVARLAATVTIDADTAVSPATIKLQELTDVTQGWPVAKVARLGEQELLTDLAGRFGALPGGAWPESPGQALVLPVNRMGQDKGELPYAVLVAGFSARRVVDDEYIAFYRLIAEHTSRAIANAEAYEEERRRAEALAEIDKAKTVFFNNISHEFRTPLTLMLGPLRHVLEQELPTDIQDQLQLVKRNGERMLKLVNSLLDFSRAEAGRLQAYFKPVDITALTTDICSSFRSAVEAAGLKFEVWCTPIKEPVYLDADLWERILFNLLSNALNFTFEGEIRVSVTQQGQEAVLTVSDTGVGIAKEELKRVFSRFHRIKEARSRSFEGTGIGLALVQELVKLHGGTVDVKSIPEAGTTFTVAIPLGKEHLPAASVSQDSTHVERHDKPWENDLAPILGWEHAVLPAEDHSSTVKEGSTSAGTKPSILIADDNKDMQQYLSRILQDDYHIVRASNGEEAWRMITEQSPALVISDVMMPESDGFELVQRIRADVRTKLMPVLLLSARAGEEARAEGIEMGADDYLIKPFNERELKARVKTNLHLVNLRNQVVQVLQEAVDHSEGRNHALQKSNEMLDNFVHIAAHDLRTPVNNLQGLLKVFEYEANPEQQKKLLAMLQGSVRGLDMTIKGLLNIIRLETRGNRGADRITFRHAFEEVMPELQLALEQKQGQVLADFSKAETIVYEEAFLLSIIKNLVYNALKYSAAERPPVIYVSTEPDEEGVVLKVEDNGIGINLEQHGAQLFKPFKRFSHQAEGNGLGLYLVNNMVERNGGRIQVRSQPGEGTTFEVHLKPYSLRVAKD